jgi:hypothetical protein
MKKIVKEIMENVDCKNDFQCYRCGIEFFPKIHLKESPLICDAITKDAKYCNYSLPFGYGHFCHCPLIKFLVEQFYIL